MRAFIDRDTCFVLTGYSFTNLLKLTGIYGIHPSIDVTKISHFLASISKNVIRVEFETDYLEDLNVSIDRNLMVITNELIKVKKNCPTGIAAKWVDAQVKAAKRFGFYYLECTAFGKPGEIYGGFYVWGKYGYLMDTRSQKKFKGLMMYLERSEKFLGEFLWDGQGRDLWKNKYGFTWHGQFDLYHTSKSTELFKKAKKLGI
jgi:hypothetical protein